MARTILSAVETELGKTGIRVLELVDIDFGNGFEISISNQTVQNTASHNGRTYTARVKEIGPLPFTVGAEDDETEMVLDNTGLYFTNLINQGVVIEEGRVKVHRLFPNLTPPNNVVADYWHGRITSYVLKEGTIVLKLSYGFVGLEQRALRRYEHTCNNLFADDLHCPYAPLTGKGLPDNRISGTATGGTSTTLVDTGRNFVTDGIQKGWLVFVKAGKKIIGTITSVAATTLTIDDWLNNGSASASVPASGNAYIVGPAFTSCEFSKAACIARGMFGPNNTQVSADLNTNERRYFIGLLQPADIRFSGKEFKDQRAKGPKFFGRLSKANRSLDGAVVPVVIGSFRVRELDLLGSAAAGGFMHGLFSLGEGRCWFVSSVTMDDIGVDSVDPTGTVTEKDSLVVWGVEAYTGSRDEDTNDLTTDQQKQAVGSRQARAVVRDVDTDTYLDNPWLINDSAGDGISPAGLCMLRIRTEPPGGAKVDATPTASAHVTGLMTQMVPGEVAQTDDRGVTDYTIFPNHIQVFYHMLRNTRYGAGRDDGDIDLTACIAESSYCQEFIGSGSQSQVGRFSGTVALGPDDSLITPQSRSVIWVSDVGLEAKAWDGGVYTSTKAGKEFAVRIQSVNLIETMSDVIFELLTEGGGPFIPIAGEVGKSGVLLTLYPAFPAGKVPAAGDTFEIVNAEGAQGGGLVRRFKANGILADDMSVKEMLQSILDNCVGTFTQVDGKISPIIRKAVNLNTVAALDIFTDKGAKRNVVRIGGESTMEFIPDPIDQTVNSVAVEFVDAASSFRVVTLIIRNQSAQERAGKVFGEKRRDKREKPLSLNLTTSRDQAARIGAILLRERGPLPNGRPNGIIRWVSPIHDSIELQPVRDVRAVASDHLPNYIQFVRIMKIIDNPDKMTVTIEARPHYNQFYDDTTQDVGTEIFPVDTSFSTDELPLPVRIESITEAFIRDREGKEHEQLTVKFTLPAT